MTIEQRVADLEAKMLQLSAFLDTAGTYQSRYSGEELDEYLDRISSGFDTSDLANRQLSNLDTPQLALSNIGAGVRPNLVHNGCFDVWQKGTSFDFSGGGNQIGPDRWSNNYQRVKYDQLKNTSPARCDWMLKVTNMSSTGADSNGTIMQIVEEPITGDQITVSFFAQSLKGTIQMSVEGAGSTMVGEEWSLVSFTKTASNQKVIIGAKLGSDLSAGYNITGIKLERGPNQTLAYSDKTGKTVMLPQHDLSKGTQLSICQRYQLKLKQNFALGFADTSSTAYFLVPIPVPFRALPVLEYKSLPVLFPSSGISISAIGVIPGTEFTNSIVLSVSGSGFTPGKVHFIQLFDCMLSANL